MGLTGRYPPTEGWSRLVPSKLEREPSPKTAKQEPPKHEK